MWENTTLAVRNAVLVAGHCCYSSLLVMGSDSNFLLEYYDPSPYYIVCLVSFCIYFAPCLSHLYLRFDPPFLVHHFSTQNMQIAQLSLFQIPIWNTAW